MRPPSRASRNTQDGAGWPGLQRSWAVPGEGTEQSRRHARPEASARTGGGSAERRTRLRRTGTVTRPCRARARASHGTPSARGPAAGDRRGTAATTTRTGRGLDSPQGWVAGSGLTLGHVHLDAGRSDGGGRVEPRGGRSRWPGPVGRSAGGPSQGGPADLTAARVVCAHGVRARGRAEPARERPPGAAHKADRSRGSPGRESVACPAAGAEGRTRLTGAFGHPDGPPPAGLPRRCCSRLDKGLTLSPQS